MLAYALAFAFGVTAFVVALGDSSPSGRGPSTSDARARSSAGSAFRPTTGSPSIPTLVSSRRGLALGAVFSPVAARGTARAGIPAGSVESDASRSLAAHNEADLWNLDTDFKVSPDEANPNPDSHGHAEVWHFMESPDHTPRNPGANYSLLPNFSLVGTENRWHSTDGSALPRIWMNTSPERQTFAHPRASQWAIIGWQSPFNGRIRIDGSFTDTDNGGGGDNGVNWFIDRNATELASGSFGAGGSQQFSDGTGGANLKNIAVDVGDFIYFILGDNDDPATDTTAAEITISRAYTVTSANDVNDGTCDAAHCSLREAINASNATSEHDQISFDLADPQPIVPATVLPTISQPVTIDGYTQTGASPNALDVGNNASIPIVLNGNGGSFDGLNVTAGASRIRGLVIQNFRGDAIELNTNGGNVIEGNFIGTNATGTAAQTSSGSDIYMANSPSNRIGGTSPAERNVVVATVNQAIRTTIPDTGGGNLVQGNYVGTDKAGSTAIGAGGIYFANPNNVVGGTAAGSGNVLSTVGVGGILLDGSDAHDNTIQGNHVGVNAAGTATMGSGLVAITVQRASQNTIGGTTAAARNVIASASGGISILGGGGSATNNLVQGNYLGTTAAGTTSLPLGGSAGPGVLIDSALDNTVGGTAAGAGNVISNHHTGVRILTQFPIATGNVVQGNLIGTNAAGTGSLPNLTSGVVIGATGGAPGPSANNTIGGTSAAARNVISGNAQSGVSISGGDSNTVQGNYIGVAPDGTTARPNQVYGIEIADGSNNLIGGTAAGAGNLVSGNGTYGVRLGDSGNTVQGNLIGTNATGTARLGNGNGVSLEASGNTLGGTSAAARNLISGNTSIGMQVSAAGNDIHGNYIGTNAAGTASLYNGFVGVAVVASNAVVGGTDPGEGNLISGQNDTTFAANPSGISIGNPATNVQVQGNLIGTNAAGTAAVPNSRGIQISGATNSVIGGTVAGARNVISGNSFGVQISNTLTTGHVIQGNYIGTNATGDAAVGNGSGISIGFAPNNTVGGTTAAARNVISGNLTGVMIQQATATGNVVRGNYVGTNAAGTAGLGNINGVHIAAGASSNTIGGIVSGAGNLISDSTDPSAGPGLGKGVVLDGPTNTVTGNLIGVEADGTTALANEVGIEVLGDNNTIGADSGFARNVISRNDRGVLLGDGATGNTIAGNFIGTDAATETADLGNLFYGIRAEVGADINTIGPGNRIAFNGSTFTGIQVLGLRNRVTQNSIYSNVGLGIDLDDNGVTPNDAGDGDSGGNNRQNFPVVVSAIADGAELALEGTLSSEPGKTYTLEFFESPSCDSSGFGQGKRYVGTAPATTDGTGNTPWNASLEVSPTPGDVVTATATDPNGNTSEFSACHTIQAASTAFVVNSTNDPGTGVCDAAECTLREAITAANAAPGADDIHFNIAPSGSKTIQPGSALPGLSGPTNIDATTQPGFNPVTNIPIIELDGTLAGNANGFSLDSSGSTIRGFVINRFASFGRGGVYISNGATGNTVVGSYVGTDTGGTIARPNWRGVLIDGQNNTVGGTGAGDRNVISGNTFDGVEFGPNIASATGNLVEGNYLGTNAAGTAAVANGSSGVSDNGVGSQTIRGNVASGHTGGIGINVFSNSIVEGNYVGTNAAGTAAIPNQTGIQVRRQNNTIGGSTAVQRNVVSGNSLRGINLLDLATGNNVRGNYVGVNAAGTSAVPNVGQGGVIVSGSSNTIGGTAAGARNVISGNLEGIRLTGGDGTTIQGNFIGTNAAGTGSIGNSNGIVVAGATGTVVGGNSPAARNVISANLNDGMQLLTATIVQGNYVGTNAAGDAGLGNGSRGIKVSGTGTSIGGAANERNVISANGLIGIHVSNGSNVDIAANYIGTDATGESDLGNSGAGVQVEGNSASVMVGGSAGGGNVISGNTIGVGVYGNSVDGVSILGNLIGTDDDGNQALGNSAVGVDVDLGAQAVEIGSGNVISANGTGVEITGGSHAAVIQGNKIGTNAAGTADLGNLGNGIYLGDVQQTLVGGTDAAARNLISGNGTGVQVTGTVDGTDIQGNYIGTNAAGTALIGNSNDGILFTSAAPSDVHALIGGESSGARNVISGNFRGVHILNSGQTDVHGNYIGTNAAGTAALANQVGVAIAGESSANEIGGSALGAGNVISGNASHGILDGGENGTIQGNYVGTNANGTGDLGNAREGIRIEGSGATVGGTTSGARNVVSGNNGHGIFMYGASSTLVRGNYAGTDLTGTIAIPNGIDGIAVDGGGNNTIGGTAAGAGNLSSGNTNQGIAVFGVDFPSTTGNIVQGNTVGTKVDGTAPLGNGGDGIRVHNASNTLVGGQADGSGNRVAYNGADGVVVLGTSAGNEIRRNSIVQNGDLPGDIGIDLAGDGVSANDASDADTGPNNRQNFPVLTEVTDETGGPRIVGTLSSAPFTPYRVDYYETPCAGPGDREGDRWLGWSLNSTNADGVATIDTGDGLTSPIEAGEFVTATATDPDGNTSEFSACVEVTAASTSNPTDATLGLAPTSTSSQAGAEEVLLSDIPPAAVRGGRAAQDTALENIPLDNIALENIALENIPIENIPVENIPLENIGFTAAMLRSALGGVHLSDVPLTIAGGWDGVLAGTTLAGVPHNTITLADVYSLSPLPTKISPPSGSNVEPLKLHQIDLSNTPLENISLGAIALGPLALENIPIDGGTNAGDNRAAWCAYMQAQGLACTANSLAGITLIEATLRGLALENIPLDNIPVENIPIENIPLENIPIENIELSGTALENIPIENIDILGTALENIPIENIGPGIVDTSKAGCGNVSTLGEAVQNDCLFAGLTLDDLVDALLPGAGASLADLVRSLPPGSTLGDILAVLLGGAQYDWESLPLDGSFPIQDFATAGGIITYRASYNVSGSGTPAPVTLEATLPAGVRYKLGSSTLTQNGVGVPIGEPQQSSGSLKLTWQSQTTFGDAYVLQFQIRPGLALGPSSASAKLTVPGLTDKTASAQDVQIEQTLEPVSQQPGDSPQLVQDALYFGHLPRGDRDYVRVPIPTAYGSRTTIDLSHLPADYDVVVLGPTIPSLAPAALENIPLGNEPLVDSDIPLAQHTQALPPETLQDVALENIGPGTTLRATSDNRGKADEHLELISQGESGVYTVLIDPFEDAESDLPYMLRVNQSPPPPLPACNPRQFPTSEGTPGAVPAIPPGVNTLFLVNKKRLGDTYGATQANNVMTKLGLLASRADLGVTSAVVSVDGNAGVAGAYAAWDANPCSPATANDVVTKINGLLDTLITPAMEDQIKNVVLVGGDDIIPFGRIPDETELANERTYADALPGGNNQFLGSFANGFLMTDDAYGDRDPQDWFGRKLYVPERALGRLVEGPGQIMAQVDQFIARSGRITPTTSLVTGYSFLIDGAQAVNTAFSGFGAGQRNLISNTWTRQDLINSLFPASGTPPQIDSINAHFDHRRALPADQNAARRQDVLFTTADIAPGSLPGRLLFTMGCHAGVPAANAVFGPTAIASDFAETVMIGGAIAYVANTGYGLGDTVAVAYSERLHELFSNALGGGKTIGESLVRAKQLYIASGAVLTLYDEKVSVETTHYGLPMYRYGPDTVPSAPPAPLPTTTDSVTGLKAAAFEEHPNLDSDPGTPGINPIQTANGFYFRAAGEPLGGIEVTPRRPIEPLVAVDVTQPASVGLAHGAVIEHLVSPPDQTNFDAAWSRVEIDSALTGPELVGEGSSSNKLQAITTFDLPGGSRHQQLLLVAGQFRSDGVADPRGIGVQTNYTDERGKIYYSSSPDFAPPQFGSVDLFRVGTGSGSTIGFAVDATDVDQNGDPGTVKRVFFLYRDCNGQWRRTELAKAPNPSHRWSGGGPITAGCEGVSYFGQAVDAAGNVAVTSRKVLQAPIVLEDTNTGSITATLAPAAPPNPPPAQHASGWYRSAVKVTLTSSAGGVQIKYSVDGGAFQGYSTPFDVTGSGVHTIDFEGSDGSDGTAVAPIDVTGPAIEITTPANGGTYVLDSTVPADYTCPDAGSGAQSCAGPVASGQPINTSSVGPKTFKVDASDVVGNTATKTVSYTVVRRNLLFVSNRTGGGDIYAISSEGGVPARLTSTSAVEAEPEWSSDGKKVLFSTNRDGNYEIYVMDADGSNPTRLTTNGATDTSPAMSPNGQKIAFASNRGPGNNWDIYLMNVNGSNVQRLTTNGTDDLLPTWSPDSQQIAFYSERSGNGDIYKMNAVPNATQTRLTSGSTGNGVDTEPAWFGSTIAFSTNRHGDSNYEIYTMTTTGASQTRRTQQPGHDINPAWSTDGAKIAFATNRAPGGGNNFNIYTMNSNGSSQTALVTHGATDVFPDW